MANHTPMHLKSITLMGYDLRNAFTEISIFEDIYRSTITGYIDIMESEFMREQIPIIGEEYLEIEFASLRYTDDIPDEYIKIENLAITKLSNLEEGHKATTEGGQSQEQYTYRLHFESLNDKLNRTKRVRKAYRGTATAISSKIMKDMLKIDLQTVDAAKHTTEVVFPNWQPFKCINWVTSTAISAKYKDPYYLFYEDRDGYHLTTMSALMDKGKKFDIKKVMIAGQSDSDQDEYTLTGMKFHPLFDTWENEMSGMYGGTLTTYDKINKTWNEERKTYSDVYGDFTHIAKEKLTRMSSLEEPRSRQQLMLVNDTKNPGAYANANEYALQGVMRQSGHSGIRSSFYLNRATSIRLGDTVNIDHKNKEGQPDQVIGGDWLIVRMRHILTQAGYFCLCDAIKDGLG